MERVEHRIKLDLMKSGQQGQVIVKKADLDSRKINIYLSSAAGPFKISDIAQAILRAEKPDGKVMFNSCTVCEDRLEYIITTQTIAATGTVTCEITLMSNSGQVLVTPRFEIIVADIIYSDTEIESTNEYTALEEAIKKAAALKDGTTFTPSVSDEGVLSWTNEDGKDNPAAVNIKGPKGDTGATGAKGDKGDTGATGATGAKGDKGDKGDPGTDGVDGRPGAAGADGVTPTIGENGNWFIGNTDTGKPSRGSGEKTFVVTLTIAEDSSGGYTVESSDATFAQVDAAYKAGRDIAVKYVLDDNTTYILPFAATDSDMYWFALFADGFTFSAYVDNSDGWSTAITTIDAENVAYTNTSMYGVKQVKQALDWLCIQTEDNREKAHEHNNKAVLDSFYVSGDSLTYNGTNVLTTKANIISALGFTPQAQPTQYTYSTAQVSATLADNAEYRMTGLRTLTVQYPADERFECWMRLTFAASGSITVTLPTGTKYIGSAPSFANGETWEMSMKDGVVVAQKVGDGT